MFRYLSIALLIVMANAADANQVIVKSGEQIGFTRVIVEFDDLPNWKTERVGRSQKIVLSGAAMSFDLSRAFRLIDRNRVGDIRVTPEGLELDIACDCEVTVSQVADTALAADFRPRLMPQPLAMQSISRMASPISNAVELDLPGISREAVSPEKRKPAKASEPQPEDFFDPARFLPTEQVPATLGSLDLLAQGRRSTTALALLGEQLSRATAQGLVEVESDIADRTARRTTRMSSLNERSNLSIATGIDRATNPELDQVPPTNDGRVCISNSKVDISDWGDAIDPRALGKKRLDAISENGGIDPKGAKSLARFYLAMGFGAEAQVVAARVDENDREILMAIGDIMDRGQTDLTVLDGQAFCKGKVALWAVLAKPLLGGEAPNSTDEILSAFSALPPHLRTHLGPILSERLRQIGLSEESRNVVNAMNRGGKVSSESELATARIDLNGDNSGKAQETLSELSLGTDTTAAEALLELLLDAERRGMVPNPDWITEDVPSLVRAVEGTDVANELNLAGLRGRINLEMFDSLRIALAEESPGLNVNTRQDLAKMALLKAVGIVSNAEFVKAEIGLSRLIGPDMLGSDLRLGLAERLMDVGLPRRAIQYLPHRPTARNEIETTVRVLLANGDPAAAVDLLEEFGGSGFGVLLGQAYFAVGKPEAAISAFLGGQQSAAALTTAIRSADWDWISRNNIDQISNAVRFLLESEPESNSDTPNGTLIANSRGIREQVNNLLTKTKPSTFGD